MSKGTTRADADTSASSASARSALDRSALDQNSLVQNALDRMDNKSTVAARSQPGETVRFGVSLDVALLERFDRLCERRGCPSRSEALRDMIREELARDVLESDDVDAAGVVTLVYDHHTRDLSRKLTERQHDAHDVIVAALHVHLDHHDCLETLILRGKAGRIRALADQLRAVRGVRQGTFSFTTTGRESA